MPATTEKLLIGNWKLNPTSLKEAKALSKKIIKGAATMRGVEVVICPPTLYLEALKSGYRGRKLKFGSQNIFTETSGAHTGELSPAQLTDLGVSHCIIGHSERRRLVSEGGAGETNEIVSRKVATALRHKLTPIVCVGEPHRDHTATYLEFIENQLIESLAGLSARNLDSIIIAYEPIWAIGGQSKNAITAHDLHEMKLYLQKIISKHWGRPTANRATIIYGGSVKPDNAANLSHEGNMDGFLVGGASLDADSFISIGKSI